MLRKILGKEPEGLCQAEEAAVMRLAVAHQQLVSEDGHVHTKSEAAFHACTMFLDALDEAALAVRADAAPRAYREAFTVNYRALFPGETRNYRVDVLEASIEQYAVIWVNGDQFMFSAEAMRRAEVLQRSWTELGALLGRWRRTSEEPRACSRPARSELRGTLTTFDFAWAGFEEKYISELIEIEEKSRRLIVQAVEHERCLQFLELRNSGNPDLHLLPDYQKKQRKLVACISHLNSVANYRRKGRDDLSADVLYDAIATLERCGCAGEDAGTDSVATRAARVLAADVVGSFDAMRGYFREVGRCLERVDPHLCNNAGLVGRLVDWEESWEVGSRYVQHQHLLKSVCDMVADVHVAQQVVPALESMCDECGVELFFVLPRIVWLRFLVAPTQHAELMKSLLPHRFTGVDRLWDDGVQRFLTNFQSVQQALGQALAKTAPERPDAGASAERATWEILIKRIVGGTEGLEDVYGCLAPALRDEAQSGVEGFMRELELWSLELQRHCPEDWNQCCAILVQCITGGSQKAKPAPFQV